MLSAQLDSALVQDPPSFNHEDERVLYYMNAGDDLCRQVGRQDAVVGPALADLREKRREINGSSDTPALRTAYIFSTLKRPKEAETLRTIYGHWFYLVGAQAPYGFRRNNLLSEVQNTRTNPTKAENETDSLLLRDRKDEENWFGENVLQTFPRSDVFVDVSSSGYENEVQRFFNLIFEQVDDATGTPRNDEYAMAMAHFTARRSSSLTRRVGATLVDSKGQIVATGMNEVPKYQGGHYTSDDSNGRDVTKRTDYSKVELKAILNDTLQRLSQEYLNRETVERIASDIDGLVVELLSRDEAGEGKDSGTLADSRLSGLVEYHRAVHAEMSAILDCARRGVPTRGLYLYTTTYPCHLCAKEVIAAGIELVVYIDPYPKSRAAAMYSEAIGETGDQQTLRFRPFVGIAPRCFDILFEPSRSLTTRSDKQERRPLSAYSFDFEGIARRELEEVMALRVDAEREEGNES